MTSRSASANTEVVLEFKKVLVCNRGEIACRVLRTLERLGVPSVAVFSDADTLAPHVALADEAVRLGPAPLKESYLCVPAILEAIQRTGADAVHPGYGLLSENADFADAVRGAGVVFIGPGSGALRALGDKVSARALARRAGVEPPPGTDGPVAAEDLAFALREAERIGFPILVKAAGGGGGIGMQVVNQPSDLAQALRACADRAGAAFADSRVYLERWLSAPRHVEVQIFRDRQGNAKALGERECSVQRRHQKIIEESPSPAAFFNGEAGARRRDSLHQAALGVVEEAGYEGAGTVEFLGDAEGNLYFLEVNARLQVEHPVTEAVTGLDLVELQLEVAAGQPLSASALSAVVTGHSVEARLYAEDPERGFLPQPGTISELKWPKGESVRVDAGVQEGGVVSVHYDPLLAKLISYAPARDEAISRLRAALDETHLVLMGTKGPRRTNLELLKTLLDAPEFRSGSYSTDLVSRYIPTPKGLANHG